MKKLFVIAFLLALLAPVALAQKAVTTGTISQVAPRFMSVAVTGAPGDGNVALADAIRKELATLAIFDRKPQSGTPYRLKVLVTVEPVKKNEQRVRIEWDLIHPSGNRLGTVTQFNELKPGSVNETWGDQATGAAGAATQGIKDLLKSPMRRPRRCRSCASARDSRRSCP